MTANIWERLRQRVEELAVSDIERLRKLAATGKGTGYSPADARAELGPAYNHKGLLISIILDDEYNQYIEGGAE